MRVGSFTEMALPIFFFCLMTRTIMECAFPIKKGFHKGFFKDSHRTTGLDDLKIACLRMGRSSVYNEFHVTNDIYLLYCLSYKRRSVLSFFTPSLT